jgi:hypothetical protein
MRNLFWGFFFIYLNFNLNVNQYSLNVLPDFVGYIFLIKGIDLLNGESTFFEKARPFSVGMAVYTGILWVGALLGVTAGGGLVTKLLSLLATVVGLYISWILIQGVAKIEEVRAVDLNKERLLSLWKVLVAVEVIMNVLQVMLNLANFSILAAFSVMLIVAGLIVIILYLLAWKRAADIWGTLPTRSLELEEE